MDTANFHMAVVRSYSTDRTGALQFFFRVNRQNLPDRRGDRLRFLRQLPLAISLLFLGFLLGFRQRLRRRGRRGIRRFRGRRARGRRVEGRCEAATLSKAAVVERDWLELGLWLGLGVGLG